MLILLILVACDWNWETEYWTLSWLASDWDLSIKLLQDKLGYSETKSHASTIHILSFGDLSKEFKKLVQVLLHYPDTWIFNLGNKVMVSEIHDDAHCALESELYGVTQ